MNRPLLSAEQVAERLGVSTRYVWRLGRKGELPRYRLGKYVKFAPDDIDAFIEARRVGPRARRAHVEAPREKLGTGPRAATPRRRFR